MACTHIYTAEERLEIIESICDKLVDDVSLRSIAKQDGMPGLATILRWLEEYPELEDKYARARARQIEAILDSHGDIEERVLSGDLDANAARVVLASRQWRAEKLKPKVYGQKADLNVRGALTINRIEVALVDTTD